MGSPKHLWAGDWEDESAAAAARRRPRDPVADRADDSGAASRAAAPAPPRARRMPPPAAVAAALVLVVLAAGAVALLGHGPDSPRGASVPSVSQAPPGTGNAPSPGGVGPSGVPGAPGGPGVATVPGASSAAGLAWLGAQLLPSPGGGVLVDAIVAGGPADLAAVHPGDVILTINGRSVASPQDVTALLASLSPGDTIAIRLRRGATTFTTQATLAARPGGYLSP